MKFEMTRHDGISDHEVVVVHVTGELDIDCAPSFHEKIRAVIEPDCRSLLIDMDGLRHLDSFSLGTFLGIRQRMRAKGGSVSLICHHNTIRRLFKITNLEKLFPFFDTVDDFLKGGAERDQEPQRGLGADPISPQSAQSPQR